MIEKDGTKFDGCMWNNSMFFLIERSLMSVCGIIMWVFSIRNMHNVAKCSFYWKKGNLPSFFVKKNERGAKKRKCRRLVTRKRKLAYFPIKC